MRRLWIPALCFSALACGAPAERTHDARTEADQDDGAVYVVDRALLLAYEPLSPLFIDLRDDDVWYVAPDAAPMFDRVIVICPDGMHVSLAVWIEREIARGAPLSVDSGFVLAGDDPGPIQDCAFECWLCPDGAVVCGSSCENLDEAMRQQQALDATEDRDYGEGYGGRDGLPPDTGDVDPPDENDGTGSSGGDSGGDSGGTSGGDSSGSSGGTSGGSSGGDSGGHSGSTGAAGGGSAGGGRDW